MQIERRAINALDEAGIAELNSQLDELSRKQQERKPNDIELDEMVQERHGLKDVTVTTPSTPGEEFGVDHPWGHVVSKVIIVDSTAGSRLYQGSTTNNTKTIYLKASQSSDTITIRPAE